MTFKLRDIEPALDRAAARELGLSFAYPADAPFDVRWDPAGGSEHYEDPDGVIGQDSDGVWARVSPEVLLLHLPRIWDALDDFENGLMDTQRDDAWVTAQARAVLRAAHARNRAPPLEDGEIDPQG